MTSCSQDDRRDEGAATIASGDTKVTDDDALLRLAVWLADVAAEAALAAQAADANATPERAAPRRPTEAEEPPGLESVR